MNKDNIKVQMVVKDQTINILKIEDIEYISLTDLARYADEDDRRYPIQNWMRNKEVISYLGLWESIHNENFKGGANSTRLKMKLVVINLKYHHKNGLKKQIKVNFICLKIIIAK